MPPGQQVKVHKSASFVEIVEVCKFTTFGDRNIYWGGSVAAYLSSQCICSLLTQEDVEPYYEAYSYLAKAIQDDRECQVANCTMLLYWHLQWNL